MIIIFVTLGNLLDLSAPLLLYLYRMETVLMMHLAIECQNYFFILASIQFNKQYSNQAPSTFDLQMNKAPTGLCANCCLLSRRHKEKSGREPER